MILLYQILLRARVLLALHWNRFLDWRRTFDESWNPTGFGKGQYQVLRRAISTF